MNNAESWVAVFKSDSPNARDHDQVEDVGMRTGVSSKLPLTKFSGWLKRMDPSVLNASGSALMSEVFSRFAGEFSSPQRYLEQSERLISLGVRLPQKAL